MATPLTYPPYQQPLLDLRTGLVTKPWHLFFLSLVSAAGVLGLLPIVPPLTAAAVQALGYWTPITNGDPLSPEILFDSAGDCIVGFVPTP
jgi:hypothetical protein